MIKPSDLPSITQGDRIAQAAIESYIDEKIRQHHKAGQPWPVTVQNARAGWSQQDIDAVLEQYRAAGWQVMSGSKHALAVLQPAPTAA